jgi:hypothetical protein
MVEEKAREAGSEDRYLALAMIRATTLAEADRIDEALATLDELSAQLNPRGRALKTAGPLAIKALRKKISSQS